MALLNRTYIVLPYLLLCSFDTWSGTHWTLQNQRDFFCASVSVRGAAKEAASIGCMVCFHAMTLVGHLVFMIGYGLSNNDKNIVHTTCRS